jgi:hypothetical protein
VEPHNGKVKDVEWEGEIRQGRGQRKKEIRGEEEL